MKRRHFVHVAIALMLLAITTFVGCKARPNRTTTSTAQLVVSFIDVGKGDCILIESGGAAALVDTGYESTSDDVLAYLHERGIEKLQCIVLTHYDRDHVGGLRAIAEALPVEEVCLPNYEGSDKNYRGVIETVNNLKLSGRQAADGTTYKLGEAVLSVVPTRLSYVIEKGEEEGNDNDLSLVTMLTFGNSSFLFAGDLEKEGIAAYLDGKYGTFDVLKMPHHGQRCSKTDDLIEAVNPCIAVITDSKDDPADKKTLGHLKDVRADTYRTSINGTIVVESSDTGIYTVETEQ